MMIFLNTFTAAIVGYLLGAIPFAVLIARKHGVDIFKAGSGNPGATNVKRVVGKGAGNLCFVLDALKGFVAAGWPLVLFHGQDYVVEFGIAGLIAAIAGHAFSIFMRFRGGKGVATTIGGMLALCPLVIIIGLIVWLIVFYWKRYVSLASLCMGISLPIAAFLLHRPTVIVWFSLLLTALIIIRHRANIVRLKNGTENRFERH